MPIEKELKKLGMEQKTLNKQELTNLTKNTLTNIKLIPYTAFDPSDISILLVYLEALQRKSEVPRGTL